MQVNSSNGSLQQRFFSGTGSIGGIHLPDFNDKFKEQTECAEANIFCGNTA